MTLVTQRDGGRKGWENIPSIILVAKLDPEPVGECDCSAEANGGDGRDGPGRREEEDVQNEEGGWDHVEADICGNVSNGNQVIIIIGDGGDWSRVVER